MSRTRCWAAPIASSAITSTLLALSFTATVARARDGDNHGHRQSDAAGDPRPRMPAYVPPTDDICACWCSVARSARACSATLCRRLWRRCPMNCGRVSPCVQQCRGEDLARVRAAYQSAGIAAELSAFFPDVADGWPTAHLVIARAGASTVAELAVAGRPSILVPLPGAIDDHQTANARAFADARGASVIVQHEFSPDALARNISQRCS